MYLNKSLKLKDMKKSEPDEKYKTKYFFLKKFIISLVYENAALCDQITFLQDKILYIKEENNFLSRKLKHIEFTKNAGGNECSSYDNNLRKLPAKRKIPVQSTQETVLKSPVKLKKPATKNVKKKQMLTVSEEACGQLIFPITLSDHLTIQCLGEVVTDRSTFHTDDMIYPVGYISTKIYGSVHNPKLKCLYTCKIIDGCLFPRFEISSEDGLVFMGSTPDECHQKLLSLINENYSAKVVNDAINCGSDFFGLSNTTVHYLILSLPGVSKCVKYSFKKFNEKIAVKDDVLIKDDIEACVNYSALLKVLPESFNREHYVTDAWLSG